MEKWELCWGHSWPIQHHRLGLSLWWVFMWMVIIFNLFIIPMSSPVVPTKFPNLQIRKLVHNHKCMKISPGSCSLPCSYLLLFFTSIVFNSSLCILSLVLFLYFSVLKHPYTSFGFLAIGFSLRPWIYSSLWFLDSIIVLDLKKGCLF